MLGQGDSGAEFINSMLHTMPRDITAALRPRIEEIISGPPQGLLTVSILGAIWTASSAVEGLRTVLNRAYHVHTPPSYWFRRSMSILQLLAFAFVLISSMLMMVAVQLLLKPLETRLGLHFFSGSEQHIGYLAYMVTMLVLFVAVSAIYYLIPNLKQRFISVAPGAALVVVLWLAAAQLFTLYLSNFNQVNLIYGSLGSMIAALLFFYICNIIFIFGAELNHQLIEALGLHLSEREQTTGASRPGSSPSSV